VVSRKENRVRFTSKSMILDVPENIGFSESLSLYKKGDQNEN